jgi:hypothetical protein
MDEHSLEACLKEIKSEIFVLRLELQTEQAENRLARSNICLLAMDLHSAEGNEIAEIACAEMKDAAKKKAAKPKKP